MNILVITQFGSWEKNIFSNQNTSGLLSDLINQFFEVKFKTMFLYTTIVVNRD